MTVAFKKSADRDESKPQSQAAPISLKDLIMKQEFAGKWSVDGLVRFISIFCLK
jgi:hypothetical protein